MSGGISARKHVVSTRTVTWYICALSQWIYSHMDQRQPSRMMVCQGSACVEPYAHATELTKLHTRKNGTETRGSRIEISTVFTRVQDAPGMRPTHGMFSKFAARHLLW